MREKISIDFDSVYTNIYKLNEGMVLSEPTICAVSGDGKNTIKAVGNEAKKLMGKTGENTKIVFPVYEGEIVSEYIAVSLLNSFLKKIDVLGKFGGLEAVINVPCGVTENMISKLKKVCSKAGINKLNFVESPLLAILGARLPVSESTPYFVVDMAGGITNVSALSLDGIISGYSLNFGANKITTDIIDYLANFYGIQIGLLTAEKIKNEIGSLEEGDTLSITFSGRDISNGNIKTVTLKSSDLTDTFKKYYDKVIEWINNMLSKLNPEVFAEIKHYGIILTGICAKIYGLEKYFSDKLGFKVIVAENPESCVALGGSVVINNKKILNKLAVKIQ